MKENVYTLLLILLMSMVGLRAFADWDTSKKVQVDGLYFQLDRDNLQAQVTDMFPEKYTGDIVIPSKITHEEKTYNVTCIGKSAFSDCLGLTSIIIPNSVTSIGDYSFIRCSNLISITIPNSVTSIGGFAFQDCTGLTSVTIGNSVTSINDYAFSYCSGLTSITIPNSVTSIGEFVFADCSSLTSIKVESENTIYDSRENCNAIIETTSNELIAACKNTIIPNSVTSIGNGAFLGCSGLTTFTIPNSVTSIGEGAFSYCPDLISIAIPNSVTRIGRAFIYCPNLTTIKVEPGNTIYDSRDNCNGIIETASNELISACKNTIIPNSVTSIGNAAFAGCSDLTSVTIPNSVMTIRDMAFLECSGLTSITIPNNVSSIGGYAFSACTSLTSVTIPNSVTSISQAAFSYCYSLSSVIIGNSVTSIGRGVFYGCSILTSVTVLNPTPVTIPEEGTFLNRKNATLYVPLGSKNAYQAADYWKDFKEIVEIDITGIDQITSNEKNNATIFTLNGKRIDKPLKGINIIGGKKVIVK